MKKIFLTTVTLLLAVVGMNAATNNEYNNNEQPFVFNENGIEFAVFKDGQFDFNVITPSVGVQINTRFLDFSFNGGHNYDTYIQYDDYGAVIQIEDTTIDYDFYGRVYRIGNVHMDYNYNGLVCRIGNMYVTYDHYGYIAVNGIINNYNVNYVAYRPHYRVYRRPVASRIVLHSTPYRRNYAPVRYKYVTYRRNYATRSRVAKNYRRPGVVVRNNRNVVNRKQVNRKVANRNVVNKRSNNNNVRVGNRTVAKNTRKANNTRSYTPRASNTRSNNKVATKTRTQNNNRANTNTRTQNKKQYNTKAARTSTKNSKRVASNDNKTYRRR